MADTFDLCIYHADCFDGFCAAWLVRRAFPNIELLPAHYGSEPPDVTMRDVIIVDFSYPRDALLRMREQAAALLVLDHHKTAQEALEGLPFAIFDMEQSGAGMVWRYLHGKERPPLRLVAYIEDRDLWRFALADSKNLNAWIMSHELTVKDFDLMASMLGSPINVRNCAETGGRLRAQHQKFCHDIIQAGGFTLRLSGLLVPTVNAPHMFASEIGNILAQRGESRMAATYFDTASDRRWSLRSASDGPDVSAIAREHGGGGHFHAAGFTTALDWRGDGG